MSDTPETQPPPAAVESRPMTAAAFLSPRRPALRRVELPERGEHVYVRLLTPLDKDRLEESNWVKGADGKRTFTYLGHRVRLLIAATCDELGRPLFTPADAAALGETADVSVQRILDAIEEFNDVPKTPVEEQAKN